MPKARFFIDRCLESPSLIKGLCEAGLDVVTMRDAFGDRGEQVTDLEWLRYCGQHNLIALTKDSRISRNQVEREAVIANKVRYVRTTAAGLRIDMIQDRILQHRKKLENLINQAGPTFHKIDGSLHK